MTNKFHKVILLGHIVLLSAWLGGIVFIGFQMMLSWVPISVFVVSIMASLTYGVYMCFFSFLKRFRGYSSIIVSLAAAFLEVVTTFGLIIVSSPATSLNSLSPRVFFYGLCFFLIAFLFSAGYFDVHRQREYKNPESLKVDVTLRIELLRALLLAALTLILGTIFVQIVYDKLSSIEMLLVSFTSIGYFAFVVCPTIISISKRIVWLEKQKPSN